MLKLFNKVGYLTRPSVF